VRTIPIVQLSRVRRIRIVCSELHGVRRDQDPPRILGQDLARALRVVEVFGGSISLYSLQRCLARELQQEKLVVVDLRRGVGAGVSRGCSSGKYFSTDSHAAVQLFPQYRAVGGAREDHQ
jgi:hypothetical protein